MACMHACAMLCCVYLSSELSFWFPDEVHEEEEVVSHGVMLAYVGFKLLGIVKVRTANATDKTLVLRNEENPYISTAITAASCLGSVKTNTLPSTTCRILLQC